MTNSNYSNRNCGPRRYETIIEGENSVVRGTQRDFIVLLRCPRKLGLIGLAKFLAKEVANLLILLVNHDIRYGFIY